MSKFEKLNLLPVAAAVVAAVFATGAPAAATPSAMATAGTSTTGSGAIWSAWYADAMFSPQLSVGGALSMPGDWTPGSALPKSGSATYTGNVVGKETGRSYTGNVTGKANLVAYFDTSRIAGTFSSLVRADGRGVGGGSATSTSWGADFGSTLSTPRNTTSADKAWGQMALNGMRGEVQARFNAGTSAIGGAWYLEKDDSTGKTMVSGTFAASKDGPAPVASPAPTPAPAPAPVVTAPAAVTGAFSKWAGTPAASVVMAPKNLTPAGYAVADSKQALYVGDASATVVNRRSSETSQVTGQANVAVNFSTFAVSGKVGNFTGTSDAANFLNSGELAVNGTLSRTAATVQGTTVFTPSNSKVAGATGAFTGILSNVGTGSLAQGSFGVSNADFALSGSWRGTSKAPLKH